MYKNIFKLLMGNAAAQMVVFSSLPLITRLYSPDLYGIYGALTALVAFLTVWVLLRLELAIVICDEGELKSFFITVLVGACVLSALAQLLVFMMPVDSPEVSLWWVFPLLLSSALYILFCSIVNKVAAFTSLACSKLSQSFFLVATQVIIGLYAPSVEGLLIGNVVGFFFGCLVLFVFNYRLLSGLFSGVIDHRYYIKYWRFVCYQAPAGAINALSQNAFVLVLLFLYGPVASGVYALANRLILAPSALMGKSTRDVFLQFASGADVSRTDLRFHYINTTKKLAFVAVPLFTISAFIAPLAFGWVFGDDWVEAGRVFSCLCPWGVGLFCNAPATATIYAIGLQRFSLIFEVFYLLIRVCIVFFVSLCTLNYLWAVLAFSVTGLLLNIFYISYVFKKI